MRRYETLTIAPLLAYTDSQVTLAQRCGFSLRTVQRDSRRALTIDRASRYADALRVNPAELWPEWVELIEEEAAAKRRATDAAQMRRYRKRSHAREAEREYKRRQYLETAEYVKARARAYYWANREQVRARQQAYRARQKAA